MPPFLLTQASEPGHWRPHLDAGTLWVAEVDRRVVGFLAGRPVETRLHIDELDVQQDMQGRGIGRRLIAEVVAWARANGFAALSLTTFRKVPWNAPFYASCGFEEWPDPPGDIRAILRNEAERGLRDRCAMRLAL